MVHMKLKLQFHNINKKEPMDIYKIISDAAVFWDHKNSAGTIHWIEWPFPVVPTSTFIQWTAFHTLN